MEMIDYYNSDPFTVRALTDAINSMPYQPKELGQWLPWDVRGEVTDKLSIEWRDGSLELLQSMPRGSPGQMVEGPKRKIKPVDIPHFPQTQVIKPSEVQGVRVFGSADELETAEAKRNEKLGLIRRANELTWEFLRAGAISGVTYEKNGDVAQDWFDIFGVSRIEHDIDFDDDTVNLNEELTLAKEKSEDELGELSASGYLLIAGRKMHSRYRTHVSTRKAFELPDFSKFLRSDVRPGFVLSDDINIVSYGRAKVGDTWFIDPDDSFLVPIADGMFQGRWAPGDNMAAVNTIGIPEYVSADLLPHGKGIELFGETNPIFYLQRPRAVIRIRHSG